MRKREDLKRRLRCECVERADDKSAAVGYRGALVKKLQTRGAGMGRRAQHLPGIPKALHCLQAPAVGQAAAALVCWISGRLMISL